ncbi:unnamed protein product [Heligmosomoides polygyrus]|uniref:MSP domain-containing protein n=1 Tax=Heligmosomoides polygyrus TaxID=6339 RepID=A0A183F7T3_HELPZ|nr:unnamed protein product [Heligmosomoides polygyrus]
MHQIHNSDQRMIFKVKLSNTDDYRVSPVFGFVDASSNANIEDATDARAAFGQVQNVPNEDMFTVNLNAS